MVYYGPQVYKFHYDLDKFLKSRDLPIILDLYDKLKIYVYPHTPSFHDGFFFLREIKMTLQGTILFVTHDSKFMFR